MADQTSKPKLTVFMLVKTSPEWLALSIDERFDRLRTVFEPILRHHKDAVTLRFYDAEFYTARVTDIPAVENAYATHYGRTPLAA